MRTGLTVVGICLLLSVAIAFGLKQKYSREWPAAQDVFLGLCYFMEANGARLPASEEEFVASPFVERVEGGLRIKPPAESIFNTKVHGVPLRDLAEFKVRWGADLTALTLDDYGNARDVEKRKVEVMSWPSSPPSGKAYTKMLMEARKRVQPN